MTLEARVQQDAAFLGTEFLKLDARAREDTQKIDRKVKEKAKLLHHLATILKDKAQSRLESAADEHWSDGSLKGHERIAKVTWWNTEFVPPTYLHHDCDEDCSYIVSQLLLGQVSLQKAYSRKASRES
ncbi:hypothetical protein K1719_024320 [Acacia pycnantha]|nr:hypothetical protein K1719_024320 [Acacia pycnantha]